MISCVMVLYKPNETLLEKSIHSILNQVDELILVNNDTKVFTFSDSKIHTIELGKNMGVAYAQNKGIDYSLEQGADFVLISDQDTVYPSDYVISFKKYLNMPNVVCFAPRFYNNIKKQYSEVMIKKFSFIREINKPTLVQHVIASGSIINSVLFNKVGYFDEKLFVDYVDFEWCWRAISKGFQIIMVPDIIINHQLGDDCKKVFGIDVTVRSVFRYFYMIRNGVYLAFYSPYLSLTEKINLFFRSVKFLIGSIYLVPKKTTVEVLNKAFWIGVFKKMDVQYADIINQ